MTNQLYAGLETTAEDGASEKEEADGGIELGENKSGKNESVKIPFARDSPGHQDIINEVSSIEYPEEGEEQQDLPASSKIDLWKKL